MYDITLFETENKFDFEKIYVADIHKISSLKELQKIRTKKPLIIQCNDFQLIQNVLSNKKVDILLDPHKLPRKNHMHYRISGLTQVSCKLAKKNNIAIAISLSSLLRSDNLSQDLGRIMQNIKICRKYQVPVIFATFARDRWEQRSSKDLLNFTQVLGSTPGEAKRYNEHIKTLFQEP